MPNQHPLNYPTKIIYTSRKTLAIEITPDAELLVRAPYRMPQSVIQRFLAEKSGWIEEHIQRAKERQEQEEKREKLTEEQLQQLARSALEIIPGRVEFYAQKMGVSYGRITIRSQRTRWGSCSSKGNLNFNCLLMLAPPQVLDYVVVHELCHRLEMNHSRRFWEQVEQVMPEYRMWKKWLKENGNLLQGCL